MPHKKQVDKIVVRDVSLNQDASGSAKRTNALSDKNKESFQIEEGFGVTPKSKINTIPSPVSVDWVSYCRAIERRVNSQGLIAGNLDVFIDFLIDGIINVIQFGKANGIVPLAEGTTDTEIHTFDSSGNPITFNNRERLLNEAGSLIKVLLEKEEVLLTAVDYRFLVSKFVFYFLQLSFDKEVSGSTNPNAIPTAGTMMTECAKGLESIIGDIFKEAFVDLSIYINYEEGEVEPEEETIVRTIIPSKFCEALEAIADSCKGQFLGMDPTPTEPITETKTPEQMVKLTKVLDGTTRNIMGTNMTKDDVGKPKPDGSGTWVMNDMRNIIVGTYEVEPTQYKLDGDKITYNLSAPKAVQEDWIGIK